MSCWKRLLRVPWTARRSNQSLLKEINSEYSLEGLMLKLKLQYFGHLMQRANSLEKTLMLGKFEGRRRRGWQRMRWLDSGHEFEQTLGDGEGQGSQACCSPWGLKELDTTDRLNDNHNKLLSLVICYSNSRKLVYVLNESFRIKKGLFKEITLKLKTVMNSGYPKVGETVNTTVDSNRRNSRNQFASKRKHILDNHICIIT